MTKSALPYSTAKGFCQGAFAMMANPIRFQAPNDITFILPFHHLIGFAVELYLKSFLMHKGMGEKELMHKPYSHSLSNLLAKAKQQRFGCDEGDYLVTYLRPHETYDYRYLKNETEYHLRPIDMIFGLLSALDAYVDSNVGASAAQGREVGLGWAMPQDLGVWRMPNQF